MIKDKFSLHAFYTLYLIGSAKIKVVYSEEHSKSGNHSKRVKLSFYIFTEVYIPPSGRITRLG